MVRSANRCLVLALLVLALLVKVVIGKWQATMQVVGDPRLSGCPWDVFGVDRHPELLSVYNVSL